jgi:hypothetical protein
MNRHARPHQDVQTSTLTDDTIKIRTHLRLLGASVIALSLWLSVSLALCSVNPELSTSYSHPLGRASEWVSSGLLTHFGLVSFSLSVLLFRLGLMLMSFTIPLLSAFDLAAYALMNLATTFPLAVIFEGSTLLGTPYGGRFGELLASYVRPLTHPYPLLISTMSLLGVVSVVLLLLSRFGAGSQSPGGAGSTPRSPASPHPTAGLTPELNGVSGDDVFMLSPSGDAHTPQVNNPLPDQRTSRLELSGALTNARHVKSPSEALNARVDALLEREQALGLTPLELEPMRDEINLEPMRDETSAEEQHRARLPLRTSETPSLSALNTPQEPSIYSGTFNTPRDLITHPPQDPYQESLRASIAHHYPSSKSTSSSTQHTHSAHETTSQSPHVLDLEQRSSFLKRTLCAMGLSIDALQAEPGAVSSEFVLTLSPSPQRFSTNPSALFKISAQLTSAVRASFGRMEPAVLALPVRDPQPQEEGERLQVTWPQRSPQLARNKRLEPDAQHSAAHRSDLVSYLGTLPNGRDIYLPFVNLPSLLITGGSKVDPYLGLNLLLTELSYLASERELRYLVADPRAQQQTRAQQETKAGEPLSPFEGNAQLFTPVMYTQALTHASLTWLLKELRAREELMKQHKLGAFKELVAQSQTPLHRLVYLVPELNNLASDNIKLLAMLLDRLNRGAFDAGVHLLLNTRGIPNALTRRLIKGCPRRLSLKANEEEATALGELAAVHLMPHQQDMLLTLKQHPVRLHGWQLTAKAFKHFMRSLAQEDGVRYVCEEGAFSSLPSPQVRRVVTRSRPRVQ